MLEYVWISAKDRLPPFDKEVLGYTRHGYFRWVAYREKPRQTPRKRTSKNKPHNPPRQGAYTKRGPVWASIPGDWPQPVTHWTEIERPAPCGQ